VLCRAAGDRASALRGEVPELAMVDARRGAPDLLLFVHVAGNRRAVVCADAELPVLEPSEDQRLVDLGVVDVVEAVGHVADDGCSLVPELPVHGWGSWVTGKTKGLHFQLAKHLDQLIFDDIWSG